MHRYKINLSFNGTKYHGWQIQPSGITVQEVLNKCISTILRVPINVIGAGRTDAGVHAKMMIAHFDYIDNILCDSFVQKLNKFLPQDISVLSITQVQESFHARFSAQERTYKYFVINHKNPFFTDYSILDERSLNYEAMNEAAKYLIGENDFSSFCKVHTDSNNKVCRITHAEWNPYNDQFMVFTISANRFLRNMVRAIVGTLFEVGYNKISIDDFKKIIDNKNRCLAGSSAPAKGLFLWNIEY